MGSVGINYTITQQAGCGNLRFTDTTNYTGVGYGDIGKTTLEFIFDDDTTKIFTNFIPTEAEPSLTLYAIDLGYVDVIADTIVPQVIYTVYDVYGNVLGSKTEAVLFSCNFVTCFISNVTKAATNYPRCNEAELDKLSNLWMRYLGIQASVETNAGCAVGSIEELAFECSKFCFNGCNSGCP